MPPQDTKWHKVPLSGRDTKWHNVYHLGSFAMYVPLATTQNCIKAIFYGNKEHNGSGKIILDNCVWFPRQQQNRISLNHHGNSKNKKKCHFNANKEGSKEYIGFGKIILDNCGFH